MDFYWIRHLIKRPFTLLIVLALLSCFIISFHLNYFNTNTTGIHVAGLIRRNSSDTSEDDRNFRTVNKDNWQYQEILSTAVDDNLVNRESEQTNELISRIEDLKRIKLSLSNELRLIEKDKAKVLKEKLSLLSKNEKLQSQINKSKLQLLQLELDISANRKQKFEQNCDVDRIAPIVFNPLKSVDIGNYTLPHKNDYYSTDKETNNLTATRHSSNYAFDLSLCSLTREFRFTFNTSVPPGKRTVTPEDQKIRSYYILFRDLLQNRHQYINQIYQPCLTIELMFDQTLRRTLDPKSNNLVINIPIGDPVNDSPSNSGIYDSAALASSTFLRGTFRNKLDLVIPSVWQLPDRYDSIVGSIPPQSPLERKYFASYFGRGSLSNQITSNYELTESEKTLQTIHRSSIDDLFLFIYDCGQDTNEQCFEERDKMIGLSVFLIILPDERYDIDRNTNDQIYLALSRGAIPVILGRERVRLPFDEVIDWRKASILLPTARLPELHFILRSINSADLYKLKYHGRHIFETYLATTKQILDATIGVMSLERFNYSPLPVQEIKTRSYFSGTYQPTFDTNCTSIACLESRSDALTSIISTEILGPRERPFASQSFRRNLSLAFTLNYDLWNEPLSSPLKMYPSLPNDPVSPSEFKFLTPEAEYRPIAEGLGGSGAEFSHSLGGDHPNEQFTIVLLTYERKLMLMKTLERLKGLAYLNKILVVWNGVKQPPADNMIWPDVGVPIMVVKVDRNSLNNRFLPFDAIETDAVFSMDDDTPLRADEIVFAFRVWRQSRERIVGFPGRYHAWDSAQNSWLYNSNHSCELSMVLTGGAFIHKYYLYRYSYDMPEAIRTIVDRFMNCEDIAMNFLVAHLTRKPPIKVTSRWTFHCANCVSSLSEDDSHFRERHECLNIFASIYGYMPLMSTQHRSDSILFKTRLPHNKQKCFKFV